jgi:hypothetical protein
MATRDVHGPFAAQIKASEDVDWEVFHHAIELRMLALGIDLGVYGEIQTKEKCRVCECGASYVAELLAANRRAVPEILRQPLWLKKIVLERYYKFVEESEENDPEAQHEEEEFLRILGEYEEQHRKDSEHHQCFDWRYGYLDE